MIDYKRGVKWEKRCEKRKLSLTDYLLTCLTIVAVLALFALATWELVRVGGALDVSLGVTVEEMQSAKK